jgi:hypothetical protein
MGELPDWVPYIQAAKVLNTQPWVLAGGWNEGEPVPIHWVTWGLLYERVEIEARVQLRLQAEAQGAQAQL